MSFTGSKKRFIVSIVSLVIVLVMISVSFAGIPSLYKLLNPSSGAMAPGTSPYSPGVTETTVTINGEISSITVNSQADGFIGIASSNTRGVYYEQGYLEAQYRLEEMTILELTSQGNLSSVVGPSALSMDIFYRELMDNQIAQEELNNLSKTGSTYLDLQYFVDGINAYISNLNPSQYPILFKLLGFSPHPWTVKDILEVQQLFLWENSAGGLDPVYFNYALEKMPENVIRAFYPAYPAGIQNPIVPYSVNPSVYNEHGDISNLSLYTPSWNNTSSPSILTESSSINVDGLSLSQLLTSMRYPYQDFGSNDWAVNGPLTNNQSALVANDPHLTTSVPSIWMGFQLVAPDQNVVGVVFPGFPGVILGHNARVGWGATNGQVQETYFYAEKTSPTNPYLYYSNGSWMHFAVYNETIKVAGSSSVRLSVMRADNGVVVENGNSPIAMDWTGLSPSYELTFFLHIDRTNSVLQFQQNASEYFRVAIQNWAVADISGNIGIFPYGEYPIVERGNPRGILPGTGEYNWAGFIPISQEPYLYNPARGFVFSANQITVSSNYPYYIGWDYESGYRADEIHLLLNSTRSFNTAKMESVQLTIHDYTTNIFLPELLDAMTQSHYGNSTVYQDLSKWNGNMDINSTAATIYYYWIQNYVSGVFTPYMKYYNITTADGLGNVSFFLGSDDYYHGPLIEDLVNWTLNHPDIQWFSNPITGAHGTSSTAMMAALNQTISNLNSRYGQISSTWEWGNIHKRYLSSLFGINSFNTPEIPAAGDGNTINAAYGTLSDFGPSWRMVANMSHAYTGVGIYPGGISENPLSIYYDNNFEPWNDGIYYRLIPVTAPAQFLYMYPGGANP